MGRSSPPGPAFTSKYNVEEHLKSISTTKSGFSWTIIRPSQFMDNLLPSSPFMFKLTRTMLLRRTFYTHPERKHQMVSTRDIGRVSAWAFEHPEEFRGRTICLSGDEFTMPELEAIYNEVSGWQLRSVSTRSPFEAKPRDQGLLDDRKWANQSRKPSLPSYHSSRSSSLSSDRWPR
jgi:uncharacterized protein YbjT (DUF2867 family)